MTKPETDFDVLVIGAGPGGYVAAIRAAQLGLKTACVEARETLGGTCLNVGCIPSKALLHASRQYDELASGHTASLGIGHGDVTLDLPAMHKSKDASVTTLTKGIAGLFRKNKVTWLKGHCAFKSAHEVVVSDKTYTAKNFIIATGSRPAMLSGIAVDHDRIVDSTDALGFETVPEHLAVIGGGVIGLELGSVWKRLGAKVTVLEYQDSILPEMDEDVRAEATKLFKQQGLELQTEMEVTSVAYEGDSVAVQMIHRKSGKADSLTVDKVLAATGRVPNTEGLALEAAGLAVNARGQIVVDGAFRTAVSHIHAIGDVTPGQMLAHRAEDEGIAVAEIIAGEPGTVNHTLIPSVVYTWPEIAGVGLTETEAKANGKINVGKFPFAANSRAKVNHENGGFVKIISDATSDEVLGVWIISPQAGTMIAQAVQAMEFGATSEDIAYTCHAHPTHAEAMKEAAMSVRGKPIHF